jgi:large subunit ribosomal protein L9
MDVILLERVAKLGQLGEVVKVKTGYARNFLLPMGKALRATEGNKGLFEKQKAQLETRNLELKSEARKVADKLEGKSFVMIRSAGDSGVLYGSVSTRDIAASITADGFTVNRNQIVLMQPIKTLGVHNMPVTLHPEVEVKISVNIARSAEEADRQSRGEVMTSGREVDNLDDLGLEIGAAMEEASGGRDRNRDRDR